MLTAVTSAKSRNRSKLSKAEVRRPMVWAVDLTEKDLRDFREMADILNVWTGGHQEIVPMSILPPLTGLPLDIVARMQKSRTVSAQFDKLLEQVTARHVKSLKTVIQKNPKERTINTFLRYALKLNPDFVAVQTHSRHGLQHLGSFSEALIGCSPKPVFAVNPKTKIPREMKRILFATKFDPKSYQSLNTVITWAKQRDAEVILWHKFEDPLLIATTAAYALVIDPATYQEMYDEEFAEAQRRLEFWKKRVEARGVKCQGIISTQATSIGDGVLQAAQERDANAIVMTTHRGPLGQRLLGSAARDVLIGAECPVIVIHEAKGG